MNNNMPAVFLDLLSNPQEAKRQINEYASTIDGDPEKKVKQLVDSGQMTQAQYNMLSKVAGMLMKFM